MPPRRRFTRKELNYLRMIYIIVKIFPKILVQVFKREWKRWTSLTWRDDRESGNEFWARESSGSRYRTINVTIGRGDSSRFDSTVLFYLILNSSSIGQNLWKYDRHVQYQVNKLRELRNEAVHRSSIELRTREFESFHEKVRRCFRSLGFCTKDLEAVRTMVSFDEELERDRRQLRKYEEYFHWRSSRFKEFSRKYGKHTLKTRDLRRKGILTDQDVERLERETDETLKNAMLVDCVLYNGSASTSKFLNILHQSDSDLAESFANTFPHQSLIRATVVSPESMPKSSCQYPKNYTAIMLQFTKCIYSMDWESMDQKGRLFLENSEDWSVKLFIMIELAYGYNVRGESERAIAILEEVTQNAFRAGPNALRILSRTYSRKSLHCIHVHRFDKAESYASEANSLISNMESPEEEIVGLKRLTDCILYEEGTVQQRRKKSWPIYRKIIEMCRRYIDDIPRCLYYLRFIYHDMARLCLGFTRYGFVETTEDELEEGESYIKRLEEPGLKTLGGNTYTDAFRFICKSIAVFKRGKLSQNELKRRELWNEGFGHKQRATRICNALNNKNNEAMFMLDSLNQYVTKWQIK